MTTKEDKFYFIFFCVLLIAAAAMRWPYLFAQAMWSDEGLYAWLSHRIFECPAAVFLKEVNDPHPPLFAIFLALGHLLFSSELACRFVIFIFYLLGIYVIYLLGARIKSLFAGSVAAGMLAFNYFYFFYSTKILQDVAVVTLFMVLFLVLPDADDRGYAKDFGVGACAAALVFMKKAGLLALLAVPVMSLHYLLALNKMRITDRLIRLSIPLAMMGGILGLSMLNNYDQMGPSSVMINLTDFSFGRDRWHQFLTALTFPRHPFLFLLILWGAVSARRDARILLLSWLGTFVLGLLSLKIGIYERYTLYILPALILLFAIGLEGFIDFVLRRWKLSGRSLKAIIAAGMCIFFIYQMSERQASLRSNEYFFQGYRVAAERVRQLYRPGTLVVAGSARQLRYYTGINFQEFGGDMIGVPMVREEFEKVVKQNKDIILVIDRWETLQPQWAFPLTEKGLEYLKSLGFKADGQVERECLTFEGKEKAPVFWIFTKNPQNDKE